MSKVRGFEIVESRKTSTNIILPIRGDVGSAAYDIFSPIDIVIMPNRQELIWTDVKAYMQQNEVLLLNVRSSQGKHRISLANTIGVVDSTYYNNLGNEGNIGVFLRNEGFEPYRIAYGDRICQAMFINYLTADNDNVLSEERKGGFGSTGK